MFKERLEVERLVYQVFDILDPDGDNTEFWKREFANMSDEQFRKYMKGDFPFYLQTGAFKEPTMKQIIQAFDVINVPLLEELYMPNKYKDSNNTPIKSKECLVVYLPIKRMKQIITKKNSMSINIDTRDVRTGLLTGYDKNSKQSDREAEAIAIRSLDAVSKELSRSRADSMNDKSIMYNTINNLGQVYLSDLPDEISDSISNNLTSTYFIGAQLYTNLVNQEYYLPHTLKMKQRKTERNIQN